MRALTTTLTILVLTFALAACGGDEPTTDAGDQDPVKTDTPAVDDPTPDDTPAVADPATGPLSVFESLKSAVLNKDFASLYDVLSSDTRATIDTQIDQARQLIKTAEGQAPMAVELAKGQLGDKYGFSYDDLMNKPTRDLGGKIIDKAFGDSIPGVLTGEVQGEPKVDGDEATLTVKKANGKMKDVEMVKEDDAWKLKYDL